MSLNEASANFSIASYEIELTYLTLEFVGLGKPSRFRAPSNLAVAFEMAVPLEFRFPFWKSGLIVFNCNLVRPLFMLRRIRRCSDLLWVRSGSSVEVLSERATIMAGVMLCVGTSRVISTR